jgi:hypothetical protein
MSSKPPLQNSTRLENLSLGPQHVAFELDGHPVQLDSNGYAAPVASLSEFYRQALADYNQRTAQLNHQHAAARKPLLTRLFSWVGRLFERFAPVARAPAGTTGAPPVVALAPQLDPVDTGRRSAGQTSARPDASFSAAVPQEIAASRTHLHPDLASSKASPKRIETPKPASDGRVPTAPVLHLVFADKDGVHVIWQLTLTKTELKPAASTQDGSSASKSELKLTYSLDSLVAQRLQDCYGQLTQLGYKIADLDSVRAEPGKIASKKEIQAQAAELSPAPPIPVAVEGPACESSKPAETKSSPRKLRPEAVTVQTEPAKLSAPSPDRAPTLLPGV